MPAIGGFEIKAGGEGVGGAGEHHRMGLEIIEEAARRMRELDHELLVEGVEVRLAIEAHNGNGTALLNGHIVKLHGVALRAECSVSLL